MGWTLPACGPTGAKGMAEASVCVCGGCWEAWASGLIDDAEAKGVLGNEDALGGNFESPTPTVRG